jgi:hypothetical protein
MRNMSAPEALSELDQLSGEPSTGLRLARTEAVPREVSVMAQPCVFS